MSLTISSYQQSELMIRNLVRMSKEVLQIYTNCCSTVLQNKLNDAIAFTVDHISVWSFLFIEKTTNNTIVISRLPII